MKAEAAKPQGAGIPAKPCPMERVEWRRVGKKNRKRALGGTRKQSTHGGNESSRRLVVDGCARSPRSDGIASWDRLRCGGKKRRGRNSRKVERVAKGVREIPRRGSLISQRPYGRESVRSATDDFAPLRRLRVPGVGTLSTSLLIHFCPICDSRDGRGLPRLLISRASMRSRSTSSTISRK